MSVDLIAPPAIPSEHPASTAGTGAGTGTRTEETLAGVLASVLHVEPLPLDGNFFDDLGADSMVMAQFCARLRKRTDLPSVSMKDVYRNPTIRDLAAALADAEPANAAEAATAESSVLASPPPAETVKPPRASTGQYLLCGALQFLFVLGYFALAAIVLVRGYEWISAGDGAVDVYLRSVLLASAVFVGSCTLPIVLKWALIGRWHRQQIRVWSLSYVRFWIVKTLIRANPLALFLGSPLYVLYLRALGARVGRGAVILSRHVPVCTDLLTIGDRTVIRKDTFFTCYRAEGGVIQTGAVTLGDDVVVGEASVLDIETSIGDGAQLGHASSLHVGQSVLAGERRSGYSAQQRTDVDYRAVDPMRSSTLRRATHAIVQVLTTVALRLPLAIGGVMLLIAAIPQLAAVVESGPPSPTSWLFYTDALAVAFVLFFGGALAGFVVVLTVPRVLNRFIQPDRTYPLYGFHHWVHRAIERTTNVAYFPRALGDSSYIVPYLRWLGYDLSDVVQTGSNFGLEVKHENPFLCTIGSGTMVADGLSVINADISSTSFRVSRATIGPRSFLGNYIAYPSGSAVGDDCLIATKAMVPLDGDVREGVGLLGAPAFEIPRSVARDTKLDHLANGDELRSRLAAKNRHNATTIGLYLLSWWMFVFELMAIAWIAADLHESFGAPAIGAAGIAALVAGVVHFTLVERLSTLFRPLVPLYCSIYERAFWSHERFWKLAWQPLILDGTPFKNLTWRLLGVRIGRRVFDDGCAIVEKTLTTIGDGCTLGTRSVVQAHSQESGAFKSDRIVIGAGCTLGIGTLVHYGVTMGDGVVLEPDSFLMKGEEAPDDRRWAGNPARDLGSRTR